MRLITIKYEHLYGGSFYDRGWWTAIEPNGDVFDYGTVEHLKKTVKESGHNYQVLRMHRNGTQTILDEG